MGQVCSGEREESRKDGAFSDVGGISDEKHDIGVSSDPQFLGSDDHHAAQQQQQTPNIEGGGGGVPSKEDAERLKVLRDEQARLEMIVSTAGRGMVSVRSTRGSTGYYDQGFAAALAQHLEQTTQFPDKLVIRLPPPSTTSSTSVSSNGSPSADASNNTSNNNNLILYARLNQPQWESIVLGTGDGLAGCGGENPMRYMDNVAESLLDSVVPAKQQLFAGVSPMVENLL